MYAKQSPIRFLFFRENDIQVILFVGILFNLFLHWWPSLVYVKKNMNVDDNKGNIPSMFAFKWFSGLRQFDNTFPIRFYAKLYPLVVTILDLQSTKTKHMYFIKDHLEIGHEARLPRMCIVSDMIHIPMGSLFNNSLL